MKPLNTLSALLLASLAALFACRLRAAELAPFTPEADVRGSWAMTVDPDLPNVLILGDSISIGYTRAVRQILRGEANVFRPMKADGKQPENCGDTGVGLKNLDRWLGTNHWDVIHFNWGLWDLCYRNPKSKTQGQRDKVNGTVTFTPEEYAHNLESLVARLQATGASLIWASTTVVPADEAGRFVGDDVKYNAVAGRVMNARGIPTDDLHALTKGFDPELFAGKGDVHYKPEGYERIARQVADEIRAALPPGHAAGAETTVSFPGKKSDFHGFDRFDFSTGHGTIAVVCPRQAAAGKPWLWRGMFWGGRSPAVARVTEADLKLVAQGFHVVVAPGNPLGHPSGNANMDAAYKLLTQTYGFSTKPAMGAMSRETLSVFRWASANPDKVGCIYVDNGVCSLKSWPGGRLVPGSDATGKGNAKQWAAMKKLYGFASDEAALAYRGNPVDLLQPLAQAGVPILLVSSLADQTVPFAENGKILMARYEKLGGSVRLVAKPGTDHHPHGLEDPTPIVDFILNHSDR